MSVLLIQPPYWSNEQQKPSTRAIAMPSLGLGYLASALKESHISVDIVDLNVEEEQRIYDILKNGSIKLVGITGYTNNLFHLERIIRQVNEACPGLTAVAGGVHASYDYRSMLKSLPINYIIRFEGEKAFLKLCRHILEGKGDIRDVPNAVFLDGFELIRNKLDPPIEDLDSIPFPVLQVEKYPGRVVPILTSRGCPLHCVYCSSSAYWGKALRYRSIDNVRDEMITYTSKGIFNFNIVDDNINLSRPRLIEFCKMTKSLGIKWQANVTLQLVDEELIDILADSGCISIACGIESVDPEIQKKVGKYLDPKKAERIIPYCKKRGVKAICGVILFNYCDTPDSVKSTIEFGKRLKDLGALIRFTTNTPFKGTYQYEHASEIGMKIYESKENLYDLQESIIDTKNFKREEMSGVTSSLNMEIHFNKELMEAFIKKHNIDNPSDMSPALTLELIQQFYSQF